MTNITAKFVLERETKGAVRYQEVDASGNPLEMTAAKIGTLYIRKITFGNAEIPKSITLTIG